MTPSPQEKWSESLDSMQQLDGDQIVISGMSGLYPQAQHVKDLADILYNKKNPVTDENTRWSFKHPELVEFMGKTLHLNRFDAQFFKVNFRQGNTMDAMGRKLLEHCFQAIYDAGVNPEELSGKKVGVYIGNSFSEFEKYCSYDNATNRGLGISGCNKAMFANRISYWLNAKGPSMSIDDVCCSGIVALGQACQAISRNECEAAIVGSASLCLHPQTSIINNRTMPLCADGKTKSFDQNADGYARSEAVNVIFLQKARDAKRIYSKVLHVKHIFGGLLEGETVSKFGWNRNPKFVADFLNQFYKEAKLSPRFVEYVEAFGSAIPEADKAELEALAEVFCKGRTDPLLVGSVMSNVGYCEAASGITAITKVLLGYHTGMLAGNMHCSQPRQDVDALNEGRMEILRDNTRFSQLFTAVNGISLTGVNSHVLLQGHCKPKDSNRYKCDMPRLVNISARQDTSVEKILKDLKSRPIDPEEISLLHNIHKDKLSGHLGRGYIILDTSEEGNTLSLSEQFNYFNEAKRPLWFVYSGMGSQWAGMGAQLMRIPIFAAAIERCHKVLEPKGVNIVHIITSQDKAIFDSILNSFVGIAAVQIGLTDILTALGIVPDKIIGHSVGELGCAYADGCFTAEEMILSAYSRGLVSVQTPFIRGSMAAVGLGFEEISKLVPPEIEVACHNGPDSSTISGPADVMKEFIIKLTEQGVFAKEVPCSNIAYHSRYIAEAGPGLLKYLRDVIKTPRLRSERWVSTSVPKDEWNEPAAQYSSAEYHTNNLLSPVLFEETSRLIPSDAVLVEVAPHGLLQAILKRSIPSSCKNIPLTRRGHPDNVLMVLDAIGKLYMEGFNSKVQDLYPKVEFPVSTGTPMLSHLVEWAHHEKWGLPLYVNLHHRLSASCKYVISTHDDDSKYLLGNVIRGKTLYPFSAALVAVWDTLAMSILGTRKQLSVELCDVHLFAQPVLHDQRQLRLSVSLHRGNGHFEVLDEKRKVATGFIQCTSASSLSEPTRAFTKSFASNEDLDMTSDDIYRIMQERDYFYRDDFRSIHSANQSLTEAQILWNNNWVTFLDGLLQLNVLRQNHDSISVPYVIRKLTINLDEHTSKKILKVDGKDVMTGNVCTVDDYTRCGGVVFENIKYRPIPSENSEEPKLKCLKTIPYHQNNIDESSLAALLQIAAENMGKHTINVVEVLPKDGSTSIYEIIQSISDDNIPGLSINFTQIRRYRTIPMREYFQREVDLVVVHDLSLDNQLQQTLHWAIRKNSFVINLEENSNHVPIDETSSSYIVVASHVSEHMKIELVIWKPTNNSTSNKVVAIKKETDLPLLLATIEKLLDNQNVMILSLLPPVLKLKQMVKKWRKETDRNNVQMVSMSSSSMDPDKLPELHLAFNVFDNGVWGSECYLPYPENQSVHGGITLRSKKIGDLESLHWVEMPGLKKDDGVYVRVHFAAISNYDFKRAAGVIPVECNSSTDNCYGMDFSGLTESGDRVMGIKLHGAISDNVVAQPDLIWPVPPHWSLEDAVTVPSAYMHALYCLVLKAKLLRGMRILIHGGTGALGQAAISIALWHGCDVFVTAGDISKKRFLKRLFPDLKDDHIGNSHDVTFGDEIRYATNGRGCEIVIGCGKREIKYMSINICARLGMVVDTDQIQDREDFAFGMFYLLEERAYVPVDFKSLFNQNNHKDLKRLHRFLSEGIAQGYVRPLSRITFSPSDVFKAFNLVASNRHRGRVLLRLNELVPLQRNSISCSSGGYHLLFCDSHELGLQLADRLILRGTRKLYLHTERTSGFLQYKTRSWTATGVDVMVSCEDLNTTNVAKLFNSNLMGAVEGIYVVSTAKNEITENKLSPILEALDRASRKCHCIRYFAVISNCNNFGRETSYSRAQDGLPVTKLYLPSLNNIADPVTPDKMSWRCAVDLIERALCSKQPDLIAYSTHKPTPTLVQQICSVAGIHVTEETSKTTTLLELGFELSRVPLVYSFLRDIHNTAVPEEEIPMMTIQNIQELEENISGFEFKDVKGLEIFFTHVNPDELMASIDVLSLPTVGDYNDRRDQEMDVEKGHLSIIPGMEGSHERFRVLCERLKLPALVLQPGFDHYHETIRERAERYVKVLLKKTKLKTNFYLLGYECGVFDVLEIAAMLEEHGLEGTIFLIGGTPEEVQATVEKEFCRFDNDALQDAVIRHMYKLITGNTDGIDEAKKENTWEQKVSTCVRILLGRVDHSAEYAKGLIESALKEIEKVRRYKIEPKKLKSRVILLHAQGLSQDNPELALQKYSQQPAIVHELKSPLSYAAQDLTCAAHINRYLTSEVLKEFEEKNLCETYFINAEDLLKNAEQDI